MSTPYDPSQQEPGQFHPANPGSGPATPPLDPPPPGAEWRAPQPSSPGQSGQFYAQGDPPYGSPATVTPDDRNWAMAAHIGVLIAAFVAMGFLAPLAVLLFAGGKSDFVRRHATESLNFQITLLIYMVVGTILAFVITFATLGFGLPIVFAVVAAVVIFSLIAIIMATMAASRGEDFRYPLCLRVVQ